MNKGSCYHDCHFTPFINDFDDPMDYTVQVKYCPYIYCQPRKGNLGGFYTNTKKEDKLSTPSFRMVI